MDAVATLRWIGDHRGYLRMIDQTRLPTEFVEIDCRTVESVRHAIQTLQVRGAPAIGIAAAYGLTLELDGIRSEAIFRERLSIAREALISSRPTAINLSWAVRRVAAVAEANKVCGDPAALHKAMWLEACCIHQEDQVMCRAIGAHGASLLGPGCGVLTHCNAGGLATSDYGTALAVIFDAHERYPGIEVYVDETRPLLQGARLTAWELMRREIAATLICDSMAAQVMKERRINAVIVGADRIAANGDTANKIGTYALAVLAKAHRIPFYVAAPSSSFDLTIADGSQIPIEQRAAEEITAGFGRRTAPLGIRVYNPAFDVTPAELIEALITEHGIIRPVNAPSISQLLTLKGISP